MLQGGGALGAYEHGVVRRLFEKPNLDIRYVSGVSIGAISAAILVGARNGDPVASLGALWDDLAIDAPFLPPALAAGLSNLGNAAFYRLRSDVLGLPFWTSFYDLTPIRRRLAALVDFDRIRDSSVRLVVTATNIATGEIVEFSNADPENPLTIDHILASGSLPPGFPMTAIGGDLYWDGGLFDNTPLSPLLKLIAPADAARTRLFVVNLFPKNAPVPQNLAAVADRMIELIFANKLRARCPHRRDHQRLRQARRGDGRSSSRGCRPAFPSGVRCPPEVQGARRYRPDHQHAGRTCQRSVGFLAENDRGADCGRLCRRRP